MGSSGAGKTTLLSLLRGKTYSGKISGEIYVNERKVNSLVPYSSYMGFVPQDDIMYDELTVSENLKYAAMLFNRRGYVSIAEVIPMVHHTMELLGLSFIKHSIVGEFIFFVFSNNLINKLIFIILSLLIGSPSEKGISGGQKKRVSIGMELMKEPTLFFLDEPTSGLDSASSISLINSLNKIVQNGVNIVATLHQPRVEIFDIIHCVYLLAPGGRLAYFGPAFGLHDHLDMLGYHCPSYANVSDFVMDVISGYVSPIWAQENLSVPETIKYICDTNDQKFHDKFDRSKMRQLRERRPTIIPSQQELQKEEKEKQQQKQKQLHQKQEEEKSKLEQSNATKENDRTLSTVQNILHGKLPMEGGATITAVTTITTNAIDKVQRVPFVNVFSVAFRRQLKVYFREMRNVIISKYILVVMGILIGNLFSTVDLSKNSITSSIPSAQLAFIICVQPDLLQIFLRDTDIRLREESGGIDYIPLFLGKILGSSLDLIVSPIAFVVGYYPFIESQATFGEYVGIFMLLIIAVSGLVNFCAITFDKNTAPTITSGLVIILWTVGGIQITTESIYSSLGEFGVFLVAISPFHSSFELHMITELVQYSEIWDIVVNKYLNNFHYKLSHFMSCKVHLFLYFLLANCFAVFMLVWKRDNFIYWRTFWDQYILPIQLKIKNSETYKSYLQFNQSIEVNTRHFFSVILSSFSSALDDLNSHRVESQKNVDNNASSQSNEKQTEKEKQSERKEQTEKELGRNARTNDDNNKTFLEMI